MSKKLEHAKKLYIEGILKGNYEEAIHQYTGDTYKQHSTGVFDGKEGFIQFFKDFTQRNPIRDIQIVRAFEDGRYVFIQAYQTLNHGEFQWVTTDFFDTDRHDKLIEHWDVISAYEGKNKYGTDAINGETKIENLEQTHEHKKIVESFFKHVLLNHQYHHLDDYMATDVINHYKDLNHSSMAFKHLLTDEKNPMTYQYVRLLIGQGNFVSTLSLVRIGKTDMAQVDIFRLKDNKIVEHWINNEEILSNVTDFNSGKF